MTFDVESFAGRPADLKIALALEARGLFTGKKSPRLRQRQNKAMRKAGVSWDDIDAAFRASYSLKWAYRGDRFEALVYQSSPLLSLLAEQAEDAKLEELNRRYSSAWGHR